MIWDGTFSANEKLLSCFVFNLVSPNINENETRPGILISIE